MNSPTSGRLDYQPSETFKPKRYIIHLILRNECPQTFQNDMLTYLREALQKLDPHFASNRCQVASFLNAQPMCNVT